MFDDQFFEQRVGDVRELEHVVEDVLVAVVFVWWDDVVDRRLCEHDQLVCVEFLYGAERDQHGYALR